MDILIRLIIELIAALFTSSGAEAESEEDETRKYNPPLPGDTRPPRTNPAAMSDVNDYLRRMQQPVSPTPGQYYTQPQVRTLAQQEVIDVEILDDEPPTGRGVASHVAKHVDSRGLARHAEGLASQVALADDAMDARLHQKFDHAVGHLRGGSQDYTVTGTGNDPRNAAAASGLPTSAADIGMLLRNPDSVRAAIILNEILKPRGE